MVALPSRGQTDWDDEIAAAFATVEGKADTATTNAANAAASASAAALSATEAVSTANAASSALSTHTNNSSNPHGVTKSQVGLSNVDNTSDASKPVSTATQAALDLKADLSRTINAQTGTSYTLVLGDAGDFVTMTNADASTLTVPPNSSVAFPVGTQIEGAQLGAGQVTLTPGSGVTINASPGLKVAAQYGTFGLLKTATDTWLAFGRLSE